MVIFGGWNSVDNSTSSFLHDAWGLSLSGVPQWTQLSPDGGAPIGRDAMAATYDPLADRMVVFGGWSGNTMLGDTEFLSWGGSGTSAALSASTSADPDAVHVQWTVENATGMHAAIYSSDSGSGW